MSTKGTKLFALIVTTGLWLGAQAQEQPINGGMENWLQKTSNSITFQEPQGWFSLNLLALVNYPQTTVKTGDAHNGTSAVLLETKSGTMSNIPGLLTTNLILTEQWEPVMERNLIPFTSRPVSLKFFFKAYPMNGDTNAMTLLLTRWNTTTLQRDTVGYADWGNYQTVNQYVQAEVTINYRSNYTPDSLAILFSSSINGFDPVVGSKLYLDDISFSYQHTSVKQISAAQLIKIYPNPAKESFNIYAEKKVDLIELYNVKAEVVKSVKAETAEINVDCEGLKEGVYIVVLHHSDKSNTKHRIVIKK